MNKSHLLHVQMLLVCTTLLQVVQDNLRPKIPPGLSWPGEQAITDRVTSLIQHCWQGNPADRPRIDFILQEINAIEDQVFRVDACCLRSSVVFQNHVLGQNYLEKISQPSSIILHKAVDSRTLPSRLFELSCVKV